MLLRKLIIFMGSFAMLGICGSVFASKKILIDLSDKKFYAYQNGKVIKTGRISGGSKGRRTVTGNFKIQRKKGFHCYSSKYPRPNGGSHMPYCQFFHKGYAIHGHKYVPRYHASHGCVRMHLRDAKWMYGFAPVGTPVTVRN